MTAASRTPVARVSSRRIHMPRDRTPGTPPRQFTSRTPTLFRHTRFRSRWRVLSGKCEQVRNAPRKLVISFLNGLESCGNQAFSIYWIGELCLVLYYYEKEIVLFASQIYKDLGDACTPFSTLGKTRSDSPSLLNNDKSGCFRGVNAARMMESSGSSFSNIRSEA